MAHSLMNRIDIDALRDQASRLRPEDPLKRPMYLRVFTEARNAGYFDRMVEVAPFAHRRVSAEDYRVCLQVARDMHDLPSVVSCRRALKQPLNREDVWAFRGKPGKATPEELFSMFTKYVDLDRMSPEDLLAFRAYQMQVLGTDT